MNHILKPLLIVFLAFTFIPYSHAQKKNRDKKVHYVTVTTLDGNQYTGELISKDKEHTVLSTDNGEIKLNSDRVKSIVDFHSGSKAFRFESPNHTRYFFGPSAIPLDNGSGYYQNLNIALNGFNYGVSNHFSLGGGFEIFSTLSGDPTLYLTTKLGYKISEKFHLGIGSFTLYYASLDALPSTIYGTGTYGTEDTNLTLGGGLLIARGTIQRIPSTMLAGSHRISNHIGILSENYFSFIDDDPYYVGIQGIRIISKKNTFDIGLIVIPQIVDFIAALPFVGYVRSF